MRPKKERKGRGAAATEERQGKTLGHPGKAESIEAVRKRRFDPGIDCSSSS